MTINLTLSITDQELNDPAAMARLYKALDTLKGNKTTVIAEEELLDENGELVPDKPKAPAERKKKSAEPKEPTVTETEVRAALGKLQRTDGGKAKVRSILGILGAKNFPELEPAKYAEALRLTVKELQAVEEEDE
jgi:hypothetical protein